MHVTLSGRSVLRDGEGKRIVWILFRKSHQATKVHYMSKKVCATLCLRVFVAKNKKG